MSSGFSSTLTALCLLAAPLLLSAAPTPTQAQAQDHDPNWCERDAPGLYRQLRQKARRAGEQEVTCPALDAAFDLPKRLVLALPCDRKISFARVDISVASLLGNATTRFGGTSSGSNLLSRYTQGLRNATISGTFSLADEAPSLGYKNLDTRAYYISEYELSKLQYDLLVGDALPEFLDDTAPDSETQAFLCKFHREQAARLSFRDIKPQVGLSKFEVDRVVRQLNLYLMAESRRQIAKGGLPLVPWEQGSTGYVRLPTEAEWEYASRGGALADQTSDASQVFFALQDGAPKRASLGEVAVVSDGQSRSHLRAIGTRLPNQLGIYDMIGNAEELVLDLFQMVSTDTLQGASGGLILRGGNALTPPALLSHSYRQELPPFSLKGEARAPYMGVRLLISAPLLTTGVNEADRFAENLLNTDLDDALGVAHEALTKTRETAGAASRAEALGLIADLRNESNAEALTGRLEQLTIALERSEAAINVARAAELRSTARAAAMGIMNAHASSTLTVSVYDARYRAFSELAQVPVGSSNFNRLKEQLDKMREAIDVRIDLIGFQTRVVLDLVRELAQADPELAEPAIQAVKEELRNQGLFIYDQRAWPVFDKAYATLRQDANRDVFAEFVELMDTRRKFRESRHRKELADFPTLTR